MHVLPPSITRVIESFEKLPGIGPKSAQRLAFYLLHIPKEEIEKFSSALLNLKSSTVLCDICRNVSEVTPCPICSDVHRDQRSICVVEQPTDVLALEKTGAFHGLYHVLHGVIDPLNNIGPDELYVDDLLKRVGVNGQPLDEIIFALNATMEGEGTAMYIMREIHRRQERDPSLGSIKMTRLARGLPIGADVEYVDEVTLRRALEGRREE